MTTSSGKEENLCISKKFAYMQKFSEPSVERRGRATKPYRDA